jgi:toxin ParE1/3/4
VRHLFHPEAAIEFEEAVRYYMGRGDKLSDRFAASVRATIERILANPERWRALDDDVRRCLVRVFPYAVIYTLEHDYVLIVAVAHSRREPGYWKRRLKE